MHRATREGFENQKFQRALHQVGACVGHFFGSLDRPGERSLAGFTWTVKGKRLPVRQAQIVFVPGLMLQSAEGAAFSSHGRKAVVQSRRMK
jgi:hypothetical protein